MHVTIDPRPVPPVNHSFTTCTGRTSRVKPFTGRIRSTVLDKDGGASTSPFAASSLVSKKRKKRITTKQSSLPKCLISRVPLPLPSLQLELPNESHSSYAWPVILSMYHSDCTAKKPLEDKSHSTRYLFSRLRKEMVSSVILRVTEIINRIHFTLKIKTGTRIYLVNGIMHRPDRCQTSLKKSFNKSHRTLNATYHCLKTGTSSSLGLKINRK